MVKLSRTMKQYYVVLAWLVVSLSPLVQSQTSDCLQKIAAARIKYNFNYSSSLGTTLNYNCNDFTISAFERAKAEAYGTYPSILLRMSALLGVILRWGEPNLKIVLMQM
jgi:hypothetical protein